MANREQARAVILVFLALGLGALLACQTPARSTNETAATTPAEPSRENSRLESGPSRDLSQDERAGGHILRKHVGQTEQELRNRLERERDITGASTYTDRRTAEHVVGAAIAKSQDRIQSWLARPGRRANLVLDYDGDEAIGRTMNRGESQSRPCTHALVVLRSNGPNSYYVLTSYPECR